MSDDAVKAELWSELRDARAAVLAGLDGLDDHDVRRPLTPTGTNLLGLVKHLATWEARYLGDVFGRPYPGDLPRWDDPDAVGSDLWAHEDEAREDVLEFARQAFDHADLTIESLAIDATGHVPWWPRPDVQLLNVVLHLIAETNRHAGHVDILREQLDGVTADAPERDAGFWRGHVDRIERATAAALRRS